MAPSPFPWAAVELDYPIYACEFDPNDSGRLVVGGGGGPTRTGVGNKITIIDSSTPEQLRVASEADLSRDEDSVSSLAIGHSRPSRDSATTTTTTTDCPDTLVYAGINSSADQRRSLGRNEHLRVFAVDHSKSRPSAGAATPRNHIDEISRTALFDTGKGDDPDTYQRLLRLPESGAGPGSIGVVASALGKTPQLAIFDILAEGAPKLRATLPLDKEAEDVDVVRTGEYTFQVAYCIGYELYTINVDKSDNKNEPLEPRLTYTVPEDDDNDTARPTLRSIRYLTPTFVLAVANLPKNAGIVLQVYRLPHAHPDGTTHEGARLSISARVPGKGKAARVAVCNLTPPPPPSDNTTLCMSRVGDTQFLIAVAAQDSSISLFTLEHRTAHAIELLADFYPLRTIKKGSGAQITNIAFSMPPPAPPHLPAGGLDEKSAIATTKPHPHPPTTAVIKLATTSLDRMVSVHNIPLKRFVEKQLPISAQATTATPPRRARYVVAAKSRNPTLSGLVWVTAIFVIIMAVAGQAFLEMYGLSRPIIHARKMSPQSWHRGASISPAGDVWASLLSDVHGSSPGTLDRKVVLHSEMVSSAEEPGLEVPVIQAEAVHPDGVAPDGTQHDGVEWNELSPGQKKAWKDRLIEAGHWVEEQGEALFEEVFFDELAEVVGSMMM
jgi:hypothetical protein